jgi:hypothetical protein
MKKLIITLALITTMVFPVLAADLTLHWDTSAGATGYKLSSSTDLGVTWSVPRDAGNAQTFVWTGAPDTGLVLFRVSAYNAQGEAIRTEAGAWYRGDWELPTAAKGLGMK